MKHVLLFTLVALVGVGCSSTRTKWSDPQMRVMIDPVGIEPEQYARIQHGLVLTEKFMVVDRGQGIRAIKKEQESLHRDEADRYEDKEKWAHWGKLYGVGAVIVANVQCRTEKNFWHQDRVERRCLQSLRMYHANTGEVMVSVEGENSAPLAYDMTFIVPDWEDTAEKLANKYPSDWETRYYNDNVRLYQEISKESAIRRKTR